MPITNSTYTTDNHTQADGSRWVKETHTDQNGKIYLVRYLARPEADLLANLVKHAEEVQSSLGEFEADRCVDAILHENADMMAMTFVDTTRQRVSQKLFEKVAADPNPVVVMKIAPLMTVLAQLHPTEQDQADFLGVSLETMQDANIRFAALMSAQSVLNADKPVEVR